MTNKDRKVNIKVVQGVEGKSCYINDFRVCGNKPWGGSLRTLFDIDTDMECIYKAIGLDWDLIVKVWNMATDCAINIQNGDIVEFDSEQEIKDFIKQGLLR